MTESENRGLEADIGITLKKLTAQLAAAEARMTKTAQKGEDAFKRSNQKITNSFSRVDQGLNRVSKGGGAASNSLRQVSLQLSQVVQQTQAGGGALRALAIQLPDIGLAFGTVGIAAGIVGGSLLSVASGFISAGKSAEEFKEVLQRVEQLSKDLDDSLAALQANGDEISETYGIAADRVRAFGLAIAEVQIAQAVSQLNELSFSLSSVTGAFQQVLQDQRADVFGSVALREALGVTQEQLIAIASAFREIDEADSTEARQGALENVLRVLEASNVELSQLPIELASAVREMLFLSNEADRASESMRVLAAETRSVSVRGIGVEPQVGDRNLLPPAPKKVKKKSTRVSKSKVDPEIANINEALKKLEQQTRASSAAFSELFSSVIKDSDNAGEAISRLADRLLDDLLAQALSPVSMSLGNIFTNLLGGVAVSGSAPVSSVRPQLRSFDGGGFTGMGSRSGGVDGKGGFISVLHPNETVVDHTKGQMMGGITVSQSFQINGSGLSAEQVASRLAPMMEAKASQVFARARREGR